jgi:hypothetical protein
MEELGGQISRFSSRTPLGCLPDLLIYSAASQSPLVTTALSSPAAASLELVTQFLLLIPLQMLRNSWLEREHSKTMFNGQKKIQIF